MEKRKLPRQKISVQAPSVSGVLFLSSSAIHQPKSSSKSAPQHRLPESPIHTNVPLHLHRLPALRARRRPPHPAMSQPAPRAAPPHAASRARPTGHVPAASVPGSRRSEGWCGGVLPGLCRGGGGGGSAGVGKGGWVRGGGVGGWGGGGRGGGGCGGLSCLFEWGDGKWVGRICSEGAGLLGGWGRLA